MTLNIRYVLSISSEQLVTASCVMTVPTLRSNSYSAIEIDDIIITPNGLKMLDTHGYSRYKQLTDTS